MQELIRGAVIQLRSQAFCLFPVPSCVYPRKHFCLVGSESPRSGSPSPARREQEGEWGGRRGEGGTGLGTCCCGNLPPAPGLCLAIQRSDLGWRRKKGKAEMWRWAASVPARGLPNLLGQRAAGACPGPNARAAAFLQPCGALGRLGHGHRAEDVCCVMPWAELPTASHSSSLELQAGGFPRGKAGTGLSCLLSCHLQQAGVALSVGALSLHCVFFQLCWFAMVSI